jgi:PAS domain S-box-containing protein
MKSSSSKLNSSSLKNADYDDILTNYVEECFWVVDNNLTLDNFSLNFKRHQEKYFGRAVQKGDNILDYAPEDEKEIARSFYMKALAGETLYSEVQITTPKNCLLNCSYRYKPIYNKDTQIVGILVSALDISFIKTNESEILTNDNKYRTIIENSLDAFFFSTPDGDLLDVNHAAVEMFGYSKEEFKKLNRRAIVDHSDETYLNYLQEREKNGKMKGEATGIRKNGEHFPFEISSVAYQDDNNKVLVGTFVRDVGLRKKAQKQLEKSEKRFRALIENASDIIILGNEQGVVEYVSPAFEKITGSTLEDAKNNPNLLRESLHPDFQEEAIRTTLEATEKPGIPIPRLLQVKHKGGHYLWLEGFITNLLHDENVGAMVSNYRDITERKIAKEKIIKSENRFRALIEKGEDIIIMTNPDGIISYVSPAFEKLTGYNSNEVIDKRNLLFMHEDQVQETGAIFERLLKNPELSVPRLNRIKCKNGEYRWVEGYITNLLHDDSVQAIVSNYIDVTERKKATELIKQSESNLNAIFENTSEAFVLLDTNGRIKAFNNNARLFGFLNTYKEMIEGRQVLDFIVDERRTIVQSFFNRVLQGETIQYDRPYLKDDTPLWIDYTIRPVIENGQIKGICTTGRDITARKAAEEEIAKREIKFRSILANSHDLLLLFDADGKIEFLSPAIKKVFGYTNAENEIPNFLDNIHPEDLENVMNSLKKAFVNPEVPILLISRIRNKDGVFIWLEGSLTNMLAIPEIKAIVANFRDITERKLFEEQQELLVSIINSSEDAIISIDTNKTILTWNHGAEKIFGYTDQEVIGKSIHLIIIPSLQHEEDEIFGMIKSGQTVIHYETKRQAKNGLLIDISLTVSPIKDLRGNIIGMAKIARNISEKKKTEEKIRNNERRFRSLLQNSNDGLSLLGIDGVMLDISQTGKKILGYDESELIGQARFDLIHPDDLELVSQAFVNIVNVIEKTSNFEYRSLCKDGNYKWLEASCQNLLNDPAVGAIVVNFRDITERKHQEIEREQLIVTLNQNNNDLRNFSFITSHNLRAPLSNLLGFTQLLADIPIEDEMLNAIIDGFRTSTIQLDNTINDLIKILIIRDNNSIEQKEIGFDQMFLQVKNQLNYLIQEAQPDIETLFEDAPNVTFNETYLESILMNLMTNAIKFRANDRKLRIKIETETTDKGIMLTFADNGIGFDAERQKEKVFGLYQRFHDRPNGKGLGLYLIKSQIESLGGSIEVDSVVDVGTTFKLRFKSF